MHALNLKRTFVEWCSSIQKQEGSLFLQSPSTSKPVPSSQILAPWESLNMFAMCLKLSTFDYNGRRLFYTDSIAVSLFVDIFLSLTNAEYSIINKCRIRSKYRIQNTESEPNPNNNLTSRLVLYHTYIGQGILFPAQVFVMCLKLSTSDNI